MRGSLLAVAGLTVASALWTGGAGDAATPVGGTITTLVTGLSAPSGLALDEAGDLFVTDTDHCRVMMLAAQNADLYGVKVRTGRLYNVAGRGCGRRAVIPYPTAVAVNGAGDLFIAESSADRVVLVRPQGSRHPVGIAGTGHGGFSGDGRPATQSELDRPSGLALDQSGDLFIADTANCRVREIPARSTLAYGQAMTPFDIYTVAGTGVCGSAGRPGPTRQAQLSEPKGVAVDAVGDLLVADDGDQSVLDATRSGTISVAAGGTGSNGTYVSDGLSATGIGAELNDAESVALGSNAMYIADGTMHALRVVPFSTATIFGHVMTAGDMYTVAGALPVTTSAGLGNGTQWILAHVGRPSGVVVTPSGAVIFTDAGMNVVREIQ